MPNSRSDARDDEAGIEMISIGSRLARFLTGLDLIEIFAKAGYVCFDCVEPHHVEDGARRLH